MHLSIIPPQHSHPLVPPSPRADWKEVGRGDSCCRTKTQTSFSPSLNTCCAAAFCARTLISDARGKSSGIIKIKGALFIPVSVASMIGTQEVRLHLNNQNPEHRVCCPILPAGGGGGHGVHTGLLAGGVLIAIKSPDLMSRCTRGAGDTADGSVENDLTLT